MQKHSSLFEKIAKYTLAATLIIVPLFPKFPLFSVKGTYVAIRFEDLILLFLGILIFLKVTPNLKKIFSDNVIRSLLIFFIVGGISLFAGVFLTQTIGFKIGALHLIRRLEYIMPFLGFLFLLSKEKSSEYLDFFLKISVLVVFFAFLYGYGQRFFHFPIIITQNEEYSKGVALFWTPGSHINSTFAGHYDSAAVMVLLIPIFLTFFATVKSYVEKTVFLLSSALGFWLLVNSLSRIAQVSYLLAVFVSLLFAKKFKTLIVVATLSVFLIGRSSGLEVRFTRIFEVFYQKIVNTKKIVNSFPKFTVMAEESVIPVKRDIPTPPPAPPEVFEDRSTSIRLNVEWPRAIRAFSKNFILGTGYSSINLATDNDYLRLLGEVGILGFAAFFLIFFNIGKEFLAAYKNRDKLPVSDRTFLYALFGGVLGTFLSACFLDLFEASKFAILFWFMMGLGLYLIRSKNYVQKN